MDFNMGYLVIKRLSQKTSELSGPNDCQRHEHVYG